MANKPVTFDEILDEQEFPAVAANEEGSIFFVNDRFLDAYGWLRDDLAGKPLNKIVPPYMRDAHNLGFSSFLATGKRRIMDKEISLPVLCKDGSIRHSMHLITAKKVDERWQFAARIKPLEHA